VASLSFLVAPLSGHCCGSVYLSVQDWPVPSWKPRASKRLIGLVALIVILDQSAGDLARIRRWMPLAKGVSMQTCLSSRKSDDLW